MKPISIMLLLFSIDIFAQDYVVSRNIFLPPTYHVGDRVELRLSLQSSHLDEISIPQQPPDPDWGILHEIKILDREDEKELRILFTSYYPGTQTMPPLDLGPIVLNDISIFVTSLLDREELMAVQGQTILPGTQFLIILTVLFLFILPLLWFWIVYWGRKYFRKLRLHYQENLPYRNLERNLKELIANAGIVDGRNFYIKLLDLVREYLSGRIHMDAKTATTGELQVSLKKGLDDPVNRKFIIELFYHGDLVKFASLPSTLKSRMDHLDKLQNVLANIECQFQKSDRTNKKLLRNRL